METLALAKQSGRLVLASQKVKSLNLDVLSKKWMTDEDLHLVCQNRDSELFRSRQSLETASTASGKEKRSKPPENLAERRLTQI